MFKYFKDTSLFAVLKNCNANNERLKEKTILKLIVNAILALCELHQNGIAHRDLKAHNFLIKVCYNSIALSFS